MKPIRNSATNRSLVAPRNWKSEQHGTCVDLPVFDANGMLISYWKPSFKERVKILFGRSIRITLITDRHPPMAVEVDPNKLKEVKA